MADKYHTPNESNPKSWNAALANFDAAHAAAAAIENFPESRVRNEIFALRANSAEKLSRIPAPTLGDVGRKIEYPWDDIFAKTDVARAKRMILGDLQRLSLLEAGVDWEEASGGMNFEKLTADWDNASSEYGCCLELYRECHSNTGAPRDAIDELDSAELRMLSIPAISLAALEKKLAVLWMNPRASLEHTDAHTRILGDLRRLAEARN